MIEYWRYDDGEPYYLEAISSWSEPRRPGWQCQVWGTVRIREVEEWIADNFIGEHDTTLRFNSGNPFLSVTIHDQTDATAFQLRWL
jgi:hypothetical protein